MAEITVDVGVRLNVIQSTIDDLKRQLGNVEIGSPRHNQLSKAIQQLEREWEKLQVQMSKGFNTQQQFKTTGKTIDKMEESIIKVQMAMNNIKFSDLKLNPSQQKEFEQIEQRVADAENAYTSFQEKVKQGLLDNAGDKGLSLLGDPSNLKKPFEELEQYIDKIVSDSKEKLGKMGEQLAKAESTIAKGKRSLDLRNENINTNNLNKFGLDKYLHTVGSGDKKTLSFNPGAKSGEKKEELLTYLADIMGLAPEQRTKFINDLKEGTITDIQKAIEEIAKLGDKALLKPFQSNGGKGSLADAFNIKNMLGGQDGDFAVLQEKLQQLMALQEQFKTAQGDNGQLTGAMEQYKTVLNEVEQVLSKMRASATDAFKGDISKDASILTRETAALNTQLEQTNAQFLRIQQQKQTFNSMKMAVTNFMGFNQVLNLTKRAVQDAMNHIKQLDATMNGISIVTDMTTGDLWKQVDSYSAMAQKYGTTIQGAYDVSKIYYQQGLETADVLALTEETLKLSKVSGLDYATTTDYMTTALRGFKMEMAEASTVVDVYSNLAANTAVSQEELAVAMSKTASSMESVGSTFQDTSAMIATMVAVTRESATNIGSAMKSIASRYGELTKDPQKLLDSEGEAMSFNKVDAALKSVGISMQTTDHQFRDFTDVIVELSEKWDTLDSTQQRYIATQFAGNRQQSRFLALVSNGDLLKENMETAANAEDTGTIQALKSLDSIESKINQVQVAAQQFYTTLGAEGVWKGALDGIRNYIDGLNNLPKLFGKVPVGAIVMISNLVSVIKGILYKGIAEVAKIWKDLTNPESAVSGQSDGATLQQTAANQGQAYLDALGAFVAPAAALWKKIKHPEESQEKIKDTQSTEGTQSSETTSGVSVDTNTSSVEEAAQQKVVADQAANEQMVSNAATTREKITEQYTQLQTELKQILEQAAQEKLTQENAQRESANQKAQEQIEELQAVATENQNYPAIADAAKQRIDDLRTEIESRPILASIELSPQESVEVTLNYLQEKFDQVKADIAVNADTSEATAKLMAMDVLLQDLDGVVISPEAELDDKILDFADRLSDILRKIREINENPVKIEGESSSQFGEPKSQESSNNVSTQPKSANNIQPEVVAREEAAQAAKSQAEAVEEVGEKTENAADSAQKASETAEQESEARKGVADAAHKEADAKKGVTESTKEADAAAQKARQNASKLGNMSMALNMIAGLIDKSAAGGRVFAGVLMTVAGAMKGVQAAQLAIAGSNPWMAIATALTMVISGISTIRESDTEELERLSKATEEANNRSKEANANYKLLDRSITKLNELKEARYDSAEAAEEYQTAVDELAEKYPQLITNLDAEGNAVIEAASLEAELEAARRKSAIATMEAAEAEKANIKKEIEVAKGELADTKTDINEYNSDHAEAMRIESGDTEVKSARELGLSQDVLSNILGTNKKIQNLDTITSQDLQSKFANNLENIPGLKNVFDEEAGMWKYYIENEEKLNNYLAEKYGTNAEMVKSVIEQLAAVNSETDKSIQELYGQLTSGELTEEEYSQRVQELITLISSDAAASYTYGPLLELLENYQAGTSTIQEFNDKLEAANKKSVSGKLLSNAEDYKFYQGLGDVQGLLVDALSRTTDDVSYRNVLNAFKGEYDLLNTIDQQLLLEMWGNRDQYSEKDFEQVFSGNETILKSIRDYYADVLPDYQSLLIDKLNTQFNKKIVVTDDIYGKSIEEEIFSTSGLKYLKLAINDFKHGISADLQNWISNILDLIHSYEGQGMTNAADDVARETADVLNELDKIDDINTRTSITSALKNNDITNISGIDSALKELEGVSGSEEVRKQLEELKNALIYNLPLAIDAYTDKLISDIEDVEKNIKDISKGMSISEALTALDKINAARGENQPKVSLSDMKSKGGKIYFDDQKNNLRQEYVDVIIGDLYTERDAIQEQIDALGDDEDGKKSVEALNNLIGDFSNDPSQLFNIEQYQDIAKILMDLGYASGVKDEETGEITKFQLEAEKFKELMTDNPIDVIIAALTNRMANANSTIEFTEKELQASEAINAGEYVNALALKGSIGDYKNKNEVLNALATSKTGEELGINYDALKPVQDAMNSAYDSFFSDLFTKGAENLHFEDYQLDMDQATWNQMLSMSYEEIVATYGNRASMLIEEQNALMVQAIEKDARKTQGAEDALKNVNFLQENLAYASLDTIQQLADSLGVAVEELFDPNSYDAALGGYKLNMAALTANGLNNITNKSNIVLDSINAFLDSISQGISNGLEGKLDYAGRDNLIASLKQYNIDLGEYDFTKTADGLKLSQQKAVELYNELKKIDAVAAKTTFDSLAKSLEDSNEHYTSISSIAARIAELQKLINNPDVSSARRQEYEAELAVAEEIYRVRSSTDNKDFDFMNRSLPNGMQNPIDYWNATGEAYKVMNQAAKSGYMEIQDFYNIVNEMNNMAAVSGQTLEFMGQSLSGKAEDAANLIEQAMSALTNIDGEGVKINLGKLGTEFATGAADMTGNFDTGIKAMAKSQIKMLDAAINMLEAIVAMEDLDIDKNGLDLGDIFNLDANGGVQFDENGIPQFTQRMEKWFADIDNLYGGIQIGNKSLREAVIELAKDDPQKSLDMLKQIMELDWTIGDMDVASKVQQVVSAFFPGAKVSQGQSIFDILKIPKDLDPEKDGEKIKKWAKDTKIGTKDALEIITQLRNGNLSAEKGTSLYSSIEKMLGLDGKKNKEKRDLFEGFTGPTIESEEIEYWDNIGFKYNEKGKIDSAIYQGSDGGTINLDKDNPDGWSDQITKYEQAISQARQMGGTQVKATQGSNNTQFTFETSIGAKTIITIADSDGGNPTFQFPDGWSCTASTPYEAATKYAQHLKDSNAHYSDKSVEEILIEQNYLVKTSTKVTFNSDNPNENPAKKIQEATDEELRTALEGASKTFNPDSGQYDWEIPLNGEMVKFSTDGEELDIDTLKQQALEALGIDSKLVESIATAISESFQGEAGKKIATAISEGIKAAFNANTEVGADGIPIDNINIKPTTITIDTNGATPQLKSPNEEDISISGITLTGENVLLSISSVGTIVPYTQPVIVPILSASGTPLLFTVNPDGSIKQVEPGTTITGLTGFDSEGNAGTITVTIDSSTSGKIADGSSNLNVGTVNATADTAIVEAQSYKVSFTSNDGNTTTSVTVNGIAELQAILSTYGAGFSNGTNKVDGTLELTANTITPEVDTGKIKKGIQEALDSFDGKEIEVQVKPKTPGEVLNDPNLNQTPSYMRDLSYSSKSNTSQEIKTDSVDATGATVDIGGALTVGVDSATINAEGSNITGTITLGGTSGKTDNDKDNPGGQRSGSDVGTIDVSPITTAVDAIQGAIDGINGADTNKTGDISNLARALNSIPEVSDKATALGKLNAALRSIPSGTKSLSVRFNYSTQKRSSAKGTVGGGSSFAKGSRTLMGELGPELVVSDGRYYMVGQNGAEFVDLADDAIVFNHKQTKKLINQGAIGSRGKPVTNETKAISYAKGSVSGPARALNADIADKKMEEVISSVSAQAIDTPVIKLYSMAKGSESGPALASAAAALAQLRKIRAMWQSMLDASAKDLGSQAGRGGGGGGGGGGDETEETTTTADIQRWYNWLRQIEKIEQDISYQEKLQQQYEKDRIANGEKIYETQRKQYDLLGEEIERNQKLADLQKRWYDNKRQELAESSYGKIFTYDENGLQQYTGNDMPGSGVGLDILENLTRRNVNGEAIDNAATAAKQLQYLQSVGFDINDLLFNDDGTKIGSGFSKDWRGNLTITGLKSGTKNEDALTQAMENFWANVDAWRDELDSLWDSYHEQLENVVDNQNKQYEILQAFIDNELDVENELLKAIEDREQAVIDKLQDQKDAIDKANQAYLKGLSDQLNKEKEMQQQNDKDNELVKLQRQLAILQRSGGSTTQIKSLQDQISSKMQESYYDERQKQIDAIQEASDKQLERLDTQISILTESLEYQKENGLLWNEVRDIMANDSAEAAAQKVLEWNKEYAEKSALDVEESIKEFQEKFQAWVSYQKEDFHGDFEDNAVMDSIIGSESTSKLLSDFSNENTKQQAMQEAEKAAQDKYYEERRNGKTHEEATAMAQQTYNDVLTNEKYTGQKIKDNGEVVFDNWRANEEFYKDYSGNSYYNQLNDNQKQEFKKKFLEEYSKNNDVQAALKAAEQTVKTSSAETISKGITTEDVMPYYAYVKTWNKEQLKQQGKIDANRNYPIQGLVTDNKEQYFDIGNGMYIKVSDLPGGEDLVKEYKISQKALGSATEVSSTTAGQEEYEKIMNQGIDFEFPRNIAVSDKTSIRHVDALGRVTETPLTSAWGNRLTKAVNLHISDINGLKASGDFDSITVDRSGDDQLTKKVQITKKELQSYYAKTKAGLTYDLLKAQLKQRFSSVIASMRQFKTGGMADYTGMAWLDGTPKKPEAVLNATQTDFLRNDLLSNKKTSLLSIVTQLQDTFGNTATGIASTSTDDSVNIENISINFNTGTISNDYDARRAGELVKEEMLKIARKTGNRSLSRR